MVIYCPNCGQKLEKSAKFCISCGSKLPALTTKTELNKESKDIIVERNLSQDRKIYDSKYVIRWMSNYFE